jgi:tetrahydromethanopterin S-methyltransferase subunit F
MGLKSRTAVVVDLRYREELVGKGAGFEKGDLIKIR